jgi:hypothetical protein
MILFHFIVLNATFSNMSVISTSHSTQWATQCLPEDGKYKCIDNYTPTEQNKVDLLLGNLLKGHEINYRKQHFIYMILGLGVLKQHFIYMILGLGVFKQHFIVTCSTRRKPPTCPKSLTNNVISSTPHHEHDCLNTPNPNIIQIKCCLNTPNPNIIQIKCCLNTPNPNII